MIDDVDLTPPALALVRCPERPCAYIGPWPIVAARTIAQVDRSERDVSLLCVPRRLSVTGADNG